MFSILHDSIAPDILPVPNVIFPPSKAGPADADAVNILPFPSLTAISPFVPKSRKISFLPGIPKSTNVSPAIISPPINADKPGNMVTGFFI